MVQANNLNIISKGNKPKIVIISGPTAIGKSNVSVEVAKRFEGEVISADSMQIYKGLDVGTGKITKSEMQGVVHHLLDVVEPDAEFSIGDFIQRAKCLIGEICARNKLPIIVGGTVFYLNGLLSGFNFASSPKDQKIRDELKRQAEQMGGEFLYNKLLEVDSESAKKIDKNDLKRTIRALEIFYTTGKPKSEVATFSNCDYDFKFICLTEDREALYDRIERRVDKMIEHGLVDEVKKFYHLKDCQSMQAIGYKELVEHFDGVTSLVEAIDKIKLNSRHYAKRQMTFLRSLKFDKTLLNCTNLEGIYAEIEKFLKN